MVVLRYQRKMTMQNENSILLPPKRIPWNKGKLTGAKPPLLARHVWSIRTKLQIENRTRDLAMFNLAKSYEAAMSSLSRSETLPRTATRSAARRFARERPGVPSGSN